MAVLWLSCLAFAAMGTPSLDQHYEAAVGALGNGDTEKAKLELRLSLQDNPLDGQSHFLLASLLGREGDLDQAIAGFQQTVTLEPNNAVARYNLGTALLRRNEPVAAATLLEEALSIRPDHAPSYNNLGKAYILAGVPELAAASYSEALRCDSSNAVALKNLALLTGAAGVQRRSRSIDTRKPVVETVDPTKPIASEPAATAVGEKTQPAVVSDKRGRSAVEGGARNETGVDPDVEALQELLRELPHVTAERRGGLLALTGWTSGPNQRKLLERILAARKDVLDLTSDDVGDPHHLLEVDAIIFRIIGRDSQSVGHNFLRSVEVNASIADGTVSARDWHYSAAISYEVNIANATEQRVAFLARPHLTTLSGTPASFIAGGDIVFQVSGLNSGDIKPYPFGTTLEVTPTLLRTRGEDGLPRVRLSVKAGRRIFLTVEEVAGNTTGVGSAIFENIAVTSEAVLGLNQTLILTGLNQRESRTSRSGVPGLKSIPVIKYLFSERITTTSDLAIIILLTPRDAAFWDEQNRKAAEAFVEKRRAFVQAIRGTDEDMRRFKERYPDWYKVAPNRIASHFYLLETSEAYRKVNSVDLAEETLDLGLLGKKPAKK
jgi:tetratricopeptide (TPR) repeat protein